MELNIEILIKFVIKNLYDKMRIIKILKREYYSWKNIIRSKRIGRTTCNDIKILLPKTTTLKHGGIGIIINEKVKIGKHCEISQNVTIGQRKGGVPTIGDYVKIKANAVVIGDITIGNNCVIAAGATVYKDIPPNSLVVGNCKIYKGKYKK